ncbi:MAG: hypothetical protein NXI32_05000 [bacterium]|nr:hypothetical protein [bacterium]
MAQKPLYFLTDVNYTMVSNSRALRGKGKFYRYQNEQYRLWMLDILRRCEPEGIFLVTVRPDTERELTLARIAQLTGGWQPDDCFFSTMNVEPPVWKKHACEKLIFPKYGSDPSQYIAVESNLDTWKMYAKLGIRGFKVFPSFEMNHREGVSNHVAGQLF